jgi:hypothetical protein
MRELNKKVRDEKKLKSIARRFWPAERYEKQPESDSII